MKFEGQLKKKNARIFALTLKRQFFLFSYPDEKSLILYFIKKISIKKANVSNIFD